MASGLLYHYFPSKQAILEALFERSGAYVMEAFALAAAEEDPRARLAVLVRESARLVRAHGDFWRVSYGVRFQHEVLAGLAEGIAAGRAAYVGMFTGLLAEIGAPDPAIGARLLFATLDGVFQHAVLDPGYPLDEVVERVIAQFAGARPTARPLERSGGEA